MASQTENQLHPTSAQLDIATNEARTYWYSLADEAVARLQDGAPFVGSNLPQHMLHKVPALPSAQIAFNNVTCSGQPTKTLFITTTSTMRVAETDKCDTHPVAKDVRASLLMGIQSPTPCNLSGTCFRKWQMTRAGDEGAPNLIGALSLAWAYVLSARFIELQTQEGAQMVYTDSAAHFHYQDTDQNAEDIPSIKINIGEVDDSVARWWAAILAPSQGWKATVLTNGGTSYISPWSVCLECDPGFGIIWQDTGAVKDSSVPFQPPSSQTALKILAEFCLLHGLGDQYLAAFSTALTFPTHHQWEVPIQLPQSTMPRGQTKPVPNGHLVNEYLSISRDLAYYISLSCNHMVLISSLCGSFWEPSVACNLVSPWLHPIFEEVPKATEMTQNPGRYHEVIALICGMCRPRLRALWVGAALSGLVPKIIDFVKRGTPPLDPLGFSWTASPQSFMDLCHSGPYFYARDSGESAIRRADVWRFLYLPVSEDDGLYYTGLPLSPWHPPGETVEKNCVLRVRMHKSCSRHQIVYTSWSWQLKDGSSFNDSGFSTGYPNDLEPLFSGRPQQTTGLVYPQVTLSPSQDASHEATWDVFCWVLLNHEGKPCEPIYDDDWIAGCDISDESDLEAGNVSQSDDEKFSQGVKQSVHPESLPRNHEIEEWIKNIS